MYLGLKPYSHVLWQHFPSARLAAVPLHLVVFVFCSGLYIVAHKKPLNRRTLCLSSLLERSGMLIPYVNRRTQSAVPRALVGGEIK